MRTRLLLALLLIAACGREEADGISRVTISGSAVGSEGHVLAAHIARFNAAHENIAVTIQQTPDDATQRHQLYVQWLNARVGKPDVLQLDVIWTAEFAAAGWILPQERYSPDAADFFPSTITANTWDGRLYAVPWFVDAGVLHRRSDLMPEAARSLDELVRLAASPDATCGLILDGEHRVIVDSRHHGHSHLHPVPHVRHAAHGVADASVLPHVHKLVIIIVMTARRVTANLPEELLEAAMQVTGAGITETLIEGLEQVKRRRFHERALALRGKVAIEVDLEKSRARRRR